MAVIAAYLIFLPVAALCFARLPLRTAILLVTIGGWWLLPVGRYAPVALNTVLPWWITGIALPSDMLLTKAWIPPVVAFIGATLRQPQTLRSWRPTVIDYPIIAWCLWPLADDFGSGGSPPAWLASLYLFGSWGSPWLIGRVWFAGHDGTVSVTRAIALSGLANVPVAVVEGIRPAMLYRLLYGAQPFESDGVARYIGFRPVAFLEDGNLYGLWAALAAFAALWLLRDRDGPNGWRWTALAVVNVLVALASQSAGAIILLAIGLTVLATWRSPFLVPAMIGTAALMVVAAAVYVSGVIPVQSLAHTPAGERTIAAMRAIGRGSFLWRVSQDTKTLPIITSHLIGGTSRWDWWRPLETRPWGQSMLLIGQYGIVGLLLAWGSLVASSATALARLRRWSQRVRGDPALPIAILVLLALVDAVLNCFFFFPAILAAGSIAGPELVVKGRAAVGKPVNNLAS